MSYIEFIEIDDGILNKIESKHGVSLSEVEEVCLSDRRHIRRAKRKMYKVFGQTDAGRYLLVVLVYLGEGTCRVVTARDMDDTERRYYGRFVRKD